MDDIKLQYFIKFGVMPPIIFTMNENDEKYTYILKKCIENNKPLNVNDLKQYKGKII